MAARNPKVVLIGVGNTDRGDDGAGRAVAERLAQAPPPDVTVVEESGEATALLARFRGADAVCLVDACASGAEPGTVRRFDAGAAPLPQGLFDVSTHGFGVAQAIELARALGELPPRCVVYAIEGGTFETGAPMSPAVAAAVDEVAGRLRAELADAQTMEV
jgi:hydrogenase maturation protease